MSIGPSWTRSPVFPFALCLLLTAAATALVGYAERQAEAARVARAVISASDRIHERMASYISVLRGSAGLLSRSEPVTPDEFRAFIERLRLPRNYPGTQGIGYTARFGATSVEDATALAHAAGWTNVQVWPDTPRDDVHAIVLIEPLDARNRAALGYDMRTDPTRREAMDRARDEGDVMLSGKVTLVQEIEELKQPGFLLYSPVYAGGAVPASLAERRARLQGYVYAPLRAGDLFEGIFGDDHPTVALDVHDGDTVDDASLLAAIGRRIEPSDEIIVERLAVAGHAWTVRFTRVVRSPLLLPLTLVVATLGGLLSVVVLVAARARERARALEVRARASALASQEMLRWNDMFIGILGHDLRTPLSAISLSAESLLRKTGGEGTSVATIERILASTGRMARMIDQILDLTRVRLGGGLGVTPRPVELGALVRDAVDELVRADPRARVELVTTGELAGTWDPDRLAQVFSNLVGNAVRYGLDAPVRVTLDGTARGRVVAQVHNAGVIAPSLLPVVFEPFHGCDARPEIGSPGLGLGLYITRAIVESHRGSIEVTSSDAEGTTFTVILPRGPKSAAPAGDPARRTSPAR